MELFVNLNDINNLDKFSDEAITGIIIQDALFSSGVTTQPLQAIDKIHALGKKAVIRCDLLFNENQLELVEEYLRKLAEHKADMIIYTDLGVKMLLEGLKLPLKGIYAPETLLTDYYDIQELKNDGVDGCIISKDIPLRDAYTISEEVPDYCYLRIHGPVLIAYSRRRYISSYLDENNEEYLDGYTIQELTRKEKLPLIQKSSGSWLYYACLQSFNEIDHLINSKLKGLVIDNHWYPDSYTLDIITLYRKVINKEISGEEIERQLLQICPDIDYLDINELKETWLLKEKNEG